MFLPHINSNVICLASLCCAGCNATACPRFSPSSACTTPVNCKGGNVTRLCVLGLIGLLVVVGWFVGDCVIMRHVFHHRTFIRFQLTGTVSPSIGKLTALTYMCVFQHPSPAVFSLLFIISQNYVRKPIVWNCTVPDWTIERNHIFVRSNWSVVEVLIPQFAPFRRNLGKNQLTGTITTLIGQLTTLRELFVVVLASPQSNLTMFQVL